MCEKHFHNCSSCNKNKDDINYKKLCLKNCTNKCSFCENVNNNICSLENHKDNYVNNLNCGHNVCRQCLKGCANCKNIVVSCPKCIVNYYFHKCKYCEFYLCNICSRYCKYCEDNYCPFNKCFVCKKVSNEKCSNCINVKVDGSMRFSRNKCKKCLKPLENCESCQKKYICSDLCYIQHRDKLESLIKNFEKNKNININETCSNFTKENNYLICEMFQCESCNLKDIHRKFSDIEINPLSLRSNIDNLSINKFKDEKGQTKINENEIYLKINSQIINDKNDNHNRINHMSDNNISINKPHVSLNNKNPIIINNSNNNSKDISNVSNGNFDKNKILNKDNNKSIQNLDKKIKPTKKEKVTCMSMCIIF